MSYPHEITNEIWKLHDKMEKDGYSDGEYRANFASEIVLKIDEMHKRELINSLKKSTPKGEQLDKLRKEEE